MRQENTSTLRRRRFALAGAFALAGLALVGAWIGSARGGALGPDVTVIYLGSTSNYGSVAGVRGYSVGTTSCNVGDAPLWWCNDAGDPFCETDQHPVIAQNMYRLRDGRFEQIGMGWLKHGFFSTNSNDSACGSCQSPPFGGDQLGVGCTDTYGSGLNGSRPLGMRSEVNSTTGEFPYPYTSVSSPNVIAQRIQVKESELDPAANPGALFWVEGHYIAADDAEAGNAFNNASHRKVTVSSGSFNLSFDGLTVRDLPAIFAWQTSDPEVEILSVDVGPQRFHVARKVTEPVAGTFHYEYAVHNMNADQGARSLAIDFGTPTAITNVGFRDVDHHSGEPYDTTDWSIVTGADSVSWSTDTFAVDPAANALRWGTMFSFWFDADSPPGGALHTLGLFKPGGSSEVNFRFAESLLEDGFETGDFSGWTAATEKPDP